ncbi:glycosyltransferase family 4 protein [Halorhabdus rudnickae]|uniref:glycosyltransferase family 4 protein n=1 Tax=Halorhabdus rudnickae TaxID=1775544 RepID=UPI001083CE75|nr:glycosyltransferase family 4 protein [Halorhabdus rudnickae]
MTGQEREYVLVTEYFHPDTASTGQLMTELAVGLEDRGLDMTVYTGQPNYHSGENERQPLETTHEGVLVKRIRAPQLRQSSLPRRLFNWTVFTLWMAVALLFSRSTKDREIVFVSNPPFLPIVLWPVCKLRGWEYTYIVHDLYPAQPVELGYLRENGVIARIWRFLHQFVFRDATTVVALGPAMRDRITQVAGAGFDADTIEIIHNWADGEFIQPKEKESNWFSQEHNLVEPFTLLYSGNIAEFHDLETVVKAVARLSADGVDVRFCIIGEGDNKERLVSLAEDLDVAGEDVIFLPYQPKSDLPYSLTSGDVSVVAVEEGFKGVCVSSKLYTSLAAGMPILCIAKPDDDEGQIVDSGGAGEVVRQRDVEGVVSALQSWIEQPELLEKQGTNARETFESAFTKAQSIEAYYQTLRREEPTAK